MCVYSGLNSVFVSLQEGGSRPERTRGRELKTISIQFFAGFRLFKNKNLSVSDNARLDSLELG